VARYTAAQQQLLGIVASHHRAGIGGKVGRGRVPVRTRNPEIEIKCPNAIAALTFFWHNRLRSGRDPDGRAEHPTMENASYSRVRLETAPYSTKLGIGEFAE